MAIIANIRVPNTDYKNLNNIDIASNLNDSSFRSDYYTGRTNLILSRNKNSGINDNAKSTTITFGFDLIDDVTHEKINLSSISELWISNDSTFPVGNTVKYNNFPQHSFGSVYIINFIESDFGIGYTSVSGYTSGIVTGIYNNGIYNLAGMYQINGYPISGRGGVDNVYLKALLTTMSTTTPAYPELGYIPSQTVWCPASDSASDIIVWMNERPISPSLPIIDNAVGIGGTQWVGKKSIWKFKSSGESPVIGDSSISRYVADVIECTNLINIAKPNGLYGRYTTILPNLYGSELSPPSGNFNTLIMESRRFDTLNRFNSTYTNGISSANYYIQSGSNKGYAINQPYVNFEYAYDYFTQVNFTPEIYSPGDKLTTQLYIMNAISTSSLNDMEYIYSELTINRFGISTSIIGKSGVGTYQIRELPVEATNAIINGGTIELYSSSNVIGGKGYMLIESYFTPNDSKDASSIYYNKSYLLGSTYCGVFTCNSSDLSLLGGAFAAYTNNNGAGQSSQINIREFTSGKAILYLNMDIGDAQNHNRTTKSFTSISSPKNSFWSNSVGLLKDWYYLSDFYHGSEPVYSYGSLSIQIPYTTSYDISRNSTIEYHSNIPTFSNHAKVIANVSHTSGDFYIAFTPIPSYPSIFTDVDSVGIGSTGNTLFNIGINTTYRTVSSRLEYFNNSNSYCPTIMIMYRKSFDIIDVLYKTANGRIIKKTVQNTISSSVYDIEINTDDLTVLKINNNVVFSEEPIVSANKGMGYYVVFGAKSDSLNDFVNIAPSSSRNADVIVNSIDVYSLPQQNTNSFVYQNPYERTFGKFNHGSTFSKSFMGQQLISSKTDFNGYIGIGSTSVNGSTSIAFLIDPLYTSSFISTTYPRLLEIISDTQYTPISSNSLSQPMLRFYSNDNVSGKPGVPISQYVTATISTTSSLRQYMGDFSSYNNLVQFELNKVGVGTSNNSVGLGVTLQLGVQSSIWAMIDFPNNSRFGITYHTYPVSSRSISNYITNSTFEQGNLNNWGVVGTSLGFTTFTSSPINGKYSGLISYIGVDYIGVGSTGNGLGNTQGFGGGGISGIGTTDGIGGGGIVGGSLVLSIIPDIIYTPIALTNIWNNNRHTSDSSTSTVANVLYSPNPINLDSVNVTISASPSGLVTLSDTTVTLDKSNHWSSLKCVITAVEQGFSAMWTYKTVLITASDGVNVQKSYVTVVPPWAAPTLGGGSTGSGIMEPMGMIVSHSNNPLESSFQSLSLGSTNNYVYTDFTISNNDLGSLLKLQCKFKNIFGWEPAYTNIMLLDGANTQIVNEDLSVGFITSTQTYEKYFLASSDPSTVNYELRLGLTSVGIGSTSYYYLVDDVFVGKDVTVINNPWFKLFAGAKVLTENRNNNAFLQTRLRADSHANLDYNAYIDYGMKNRYESMPTGLSSQCSVDIQRPYGSLLLLPPAYGVENNLNITASDTQSGIKAFRICKEGSNLLQYIEYENWMPYSYLENNLNNYVLRLNTKYSAGSTQFENCGHKKVWCQFIDNVGNISNSDYITVPLIPSAIIDTKYPTGTAYFINSSNGSVIDKSITPIVNVKLDGNDDISGVKDYRIRPVSSNGISTWENWKSIDTIHHYNLGDVNGRKKVEYQFRDFGNNITPVNDQFDIVFDGYSKNILFNKFVEFNDTLYTAGVKIQNYTDLHLYNTYDPNYVKNTSYYMKDNNTGQKINLKRSDNVLLEVQPNGVGTTAQYVQYIPQNETTPTADAPNNGFYIDSKNGYLVYASSQNDDDIMMVVKLDKYTAVLYRFDGVTNQKVYDFTYKNEKMITSMIALTDKILIGTNNGNLYIYDGRVVYDSIFTMMDSNGVNIPISSMTVHQFRYESQPYLYVASSQSTKLWRIPVANINSTVGWEEISLVEDAISKNIMATSITDMLSAYDTLFVSTDSNIVYRYNKKLGMATVGISTLQNVINSDDEPNNITIGSLGLAGNQVLAGAKEKPVIYAFNANYKANNDNYYITEFNDRFFNNSYGWQFYTNATADGFTNLNGIGAIVGISTVYNDINPMGYDTNIKINAMIGEVASLSQNNDIWGNSIANNTKYTVELNAQYIGNSVTEGVNNGGRNQLQISDGRYLLDVAYGYNSISITSGDNKYSVGLSSTIISTFSNVPDNIYPDSRIGSVIKLWNFDTNNEDRGNYWYGSPGAGSGTTTLQNWVIDRFINTLTSQFSAFSGINGKTIYNSVLKISPSRSIDSKPRIAWYSSTGDTGVQIDTQSKIMIRLSVNLASSELVSNIKMSIKFANDKNVIEWGSFIPYDIYLQNDNDYHTYTIFPAWHGVINAISIEFDGMSWTPSDYINIQYISIISESGIIGNLSDQMTPIRICVDNKAVQVYVGNDITPIIDESNFLKLSTTDKKIKFGKLSIYKNEIDTAEGTDYEPGSTWLYKNIKFKIGVCEPPSYVDYHDFHPIWKLNNKGGISKIVNHLGSVCILTNGYYNKKLLGMSTLPYETNFDALSDTASKIYFYYPTQQVWKQSNSNFPLRNGMFLFTPLDAIDYKNRLIASGQYMNYSVSADYFENMYFGDTYFENEFWR